MSASPQIRRACVAGMFYPGDADTLSQQIDGFLSTTPQPPRGRVRVAVSPHAGYPYSGRVAAHGFRALADSGARTVVVIGPSHVEYFPFSSVFDGDGYETPLGVIPIDRDLAARIAGERETVRLSPRGHAQEHLPRGEHSLEVQLPFVQRALGGARIVPIVMGEQHWDHCSELGTALAEVLDDDVAIVASSDLSHFHDHERAEALDGAFCEALSTLGAREVYDAVRRGKCEACGAGPVVAALAATEAMDGREFHLLERTNSGRTTGDRSSVVGYLSAIVTTPLA